MCTYDDDGPVPYKPPDGYASRQRLTKAYADNDDPVPYLADNDDPVPYLDDNDDPVPYLADNDDPVPYLADNDDPVPYLLRDRVTIISVGFCDAIVYVRYVYELV
jgi:hypothetical protein